MRIANHIKIGDEICRVLADNHMTLNKKYFTLGNLAPDITLSCYIIPHKYPLTASYIRRIANKLLRSKGKCNSAYFSFRLGVVVHFICDYFCYTHSKSYKEGLMGHYRHEMKQEFDRGSLFPFVKERSLKADCETLLDQLNGYIVQWEDMLLQNGDLGKDDMAFATYIATWFSASIYCLAEKPEVENIAFTVLQKN